MKRLLASVAAMLLVGSPPLLAVEVAVSATQITRFGDTALDQRVEGLVFRGGIAMVAQDDTFGGLSGVTATGPNQQVSFVSDRGNFVSGHLAYDDADRLFGFIGVQVEAIQNSGGSPLPRQFARDAEGIDTIYREGAPVAVRVVFEHLTRVADFDLVEGVPGGAAREVPIPDWLTDLRTNEALESVCIAPPASPVAGSTLLIAEESLDAEGNHRGWLLGRNDRGPVGLVNTPVVNPTDCAFLPNGDLLVLERGVSMLSFVMTLRRVPAADVRPGNVMAGQVLLSASGSLIDNMEALAVHASAGGETRILIGSDNNFNDWQRSLLLEFALPD